MKHNHKRIALVGASSTGKSTVCALLNGRLGLDYEFVTESTRTVARYGFPINEKGTAETQLAISSFHIEALLNPVNLVLDRCYLDLVVYSRHMPGLRKNTLRYIEDSWDRLKQEYTHFVYFPIEFSAVADGERSVNEEWRREVDREFQLELNKLPDGYLEVKGSPMERVFQILNYIKSE